MTNKILDGFNKILKRCPDRKAGVFYCGNPENSVAGKQLIFIFAALIEN
jgi:hypothetical protein